MKLKDEKVGFRNWIIILLVGFAGQFAWAIENMYLNTYIAYLNFTAPTGQGFDYNLFIALTTAFSAITATLTTLFMGSLSDKINKRKIFISFGYILWGISTAAFGFLNVNSASTVLPVLISAQIAAILVIVLDCIMTFFGSTSNDAAFNSYITKNTKDSNRGKVEGVLGVLPLIAMLVIFVGLNGLTTQEAGYRWDLFFYIIGAIVCVVGVISLFLIPKEKKEKKSDEKFLSLVLEGFKLKTIKENKILYICLIIYFIFGVATQVYFPYLMIYIEKTSSIANTGESFLTPFAIVMAVALLLGSLFSVVICSIADKKGKVKMLFPTLTIMCLGLVLMYFIPMIQNDLFRTIYASISGLVLILAYIAFPSVLNSIIRTTIPKGKEGTFMGVRMIFVVALPMCIGPFIGSALNKNFGSIYTGDFGVQDYLPTNIGYVVALGIMILILIPLIFLYKESKKIEKKNKGFLVNNLTKVDSRDNLVPFINVYPRPRMYRNSYVNLNGYWDIEISKNPAIPNSFSKKVVVPYPIESPDSLVNHLLEPDEFIYYHRVIEYKLYNDKKAILHFEGIDQIAEIFIDGEFVYKHVGGYTSFSLDVSKFLEKGSFDLIIKVSDVTDSSYHQRGKQTLKPSFCFYSSSSGIYKTVWLEETPKNYIEDVIFNTNFDNNELIVTIKTNKDGLASLKIKDKVYKIKTNKECILKLVDPLVWSPKDPCLNTVTIEFERDIIISYFAFRKIEVKNGENRGIYLNNKKIILNGILDQGYYYPNGLTPRSYYDYENDISSLKELGFNTIRKHIKVEDEFFYYLCDYHGMLIIQDIPNGGEPYKFLSVGLPRLSIKLLNKEKRLKEKNVGRADKIGKEEFISDAKNIISKLNNYGSIIGYTIFNEGRGQFETNKVYDELRPVIKDRFIDLTSGRYESDKNEVFSIHAYTWQTRDRKDNVKDRPYFLSEFGGLGLKVKKHSIYPGNFSHRGSKSSRKLTKKYVKIYKKLANLIQKGKLCGIIYTQVADCECEYNGLFTFDREVLKIKEDVIKEINSKINSYSSD